MLKKIKLYAEQGLALSEIRKELKISKKQLSILIKDDNNLERKIVSNTRLYTNKNLKNGAIITRKRWRTKVHFDLVVLDILNTNLSRLELCSKYNLFANNITKIARDSNSYDKLNFNNQFYKNKLKLEKNESIINYFFKNYSSNIKNMINYGFHLKIIQESLPEHISGKLLNVVIKKLGLHDKRLENTKKVNISNSKKGCIAAAKINKGKTYIRRPLTIDMEIYYQDLIKKKEKNGPSKSLFHKYFGTSGTVWGLLQKKYGELERNPSKFLPGKLNPMYQREPSWRAGTGIKGHVLINGKKIHFRSSLELRVYLFLEKNNIEFNLSKHRIPYRFEDKDRMYYPDITINENICEIKPKVKLNWEQNKAKHKNLKIYCKKFNLNCNYITEYTYDLTTISKKYIEDKIFKKDILITNKENKRLHNYIDKWYKK